MAMATREENYCTWCSWCDNPLCLWDNPDIQPAEFGRVYAAYGGIFIVSAIIWGRIVDKKKPDGYEILGSIVAVVGALIIFYAPR